MKTIKKNKSPYPKIISFRHQKCWRVISSYENDRGGIKHRITERMTYKKANETFNLITAFTRYPNLGEIIMCYIVAESDGIERR